MQRTFVTLFVHDQLPKTVAAREAGYSSPGTAAGGLMENPKIVQAIAVEREKYAIESKLNRQDVLDGFKEAIEMAKMMSDPGVMVAGWREIGKMCGFYEPSKIDIQVTTKGAALLQQMEEMSDDELFAIADDDIIDGEWTEEPAK